MKQYPEDRNDEAPSWIIELDEIDDQYLDEIDDQYYEDPDHLSELLTRYAETAGLIQPFIK